MLFVNFLLSRKLLTTLFIILKISLKFHIFFSKIFNKIEHFLK